MCPSVTIKIINFLIKKVNFTNKFFSVYKSKDYSFFLWVGIIDWLNDGSVGFSDGDGNCCMEKIFLIYKELLLLYIVVYFSTKFFSPYVCKRIRLNRFKRSHVWYINRRTWKFKNSPRCCKCFVEEFASICKPLKAISSY